MSKEKKGSGLGKFALGAVIGAGLGIGGMALFQHIRKKKKEEVVEETLPEETTTTGE